jgi:hypothetical protein
MDPITITIGAIIAGGAVAGTSWTIWSSSRKTKAKNERLWSAAADLVSGEFEPPSGPWYKRKPMTVEAQLHDVWVVSDHYTVSTGNTAQIFTRCSAEVEGAEDFKLKIKQHGLATSLGEALGFRNVSTGDTDFDHHFWIKSSDEELAAAWLDTQSRAALMPLDKYNLALNKGTLSATRSDIEQSPKSLAKAMEAVGTLGAAPLRIMTRWHALADALEGELVSEQEAWSPGAGVRVEAESRGARVVVDTVAADPDLDTQLVTRVTCHLVTGSAERLVISRQTTGMSGLQRVTPPAGQLAGELMVASGDAEKTEQRLTAQLCQRLTELAPESLWVLGQKVTILLPRLVLNKQRISSAVELGLDLTSTVGEGVYR